MNCTPNHTAKYISFKNFYVYTSIFFLTIVTALQSKTLKTKLVTHIVVFYNGARFLNIPIDKNNV